ncbi:MAG: hypothetical protein ACRDKW_16480 [Actinomycetota bacterium]
MPRSRPILIIQSFLAGATALLGGAALGDFVSLEVIGLANLVIAAITVGLGVYLSGSNSQTTVTSTVLATQDHAGGDVVAGPASSFTTGAAIEPHLAVGEITS